MAKWINRTLVQAPRNGTSSHTVDFTAATSGNLLVMVMEGAVTHTVPTGWTRQNRALNNSDLAVFTKTASSGESSFSTDHNGSNYPIVAVVYEFAAGSTWVAGASDTGLGPSAACPSITGLTGTNLQVSVVGGADPSTSAAVSTVWSGTGSPVEDVDVYLNASGTDGYFLSLAYVEDSTASSFQFTATTTNQPLVAEALSFAVTVASSGGSVTVSPTGLASDEAFGTASVSSTLTASPAGIASSEAFGTAVISGVLTVSPAGIASGESVGTPAVSTSLQISPAGIASDEAFGTAVIDAGAGPVTVSPAGIASETVFGELTVSTVLELDPAGIASGEAFGTPALTVGTITVSPAGIPTGAAYGTPAIHYVTTISPQGIPSVAAFGTAILSGALALSHRVAAGTVPDRRYQASITNKRWEGSNG